MPVASRGTHRLHFHVAGEDGAPLVLIPGLGSGSRLFGTLPRRFARDGRQALSFDPVGVPPSSALEGTTWSFAAAADDLWAVVDAAGFDRVDLVGTSLGGKLALVAAARRPERVGRLVLLAAAAVPSARARRVQDFFATVAAHLPAADFATALLPFLYGRSFHEERPRVVDDIARAARPPAETRALMVAQAHALADFDGPETARAVQTPTLCLAGLEDTLTDAADVRATADLLPAGEYRELPRAGHSLLLEDAAAYTATLAFLRR